jgi:predicted 2-oxoglutarate/Fe(II)-dependent dioxygenase YbiX
METNGRLIDLQNELTLDALDAMLASQSSVLAIRVSGYLPKELCLTLSEKLMDHERKRFQRYSFAPQLEVSKIGINFGEACINPEMNEQYFESARSTDDLIREMFSPFLSPLDKLRFDLDRIWPEGAVVAKMHGKRMMSGFLRNTENGGHIPHHQDDIVEEYPHADWKPQRELVSNVYLNVPADGDGGELEIYEYSPNYADDLRSTYSREQQDADTTTYLTEGQQSEIVSKGSIVIKPQTGDLIMFIGKCVHRVHGVRSGNRLTSCFHVGYIDKQQPLQCWG